MAETRSMPPGAVSALEGGEQRLAHPVYPFARLRWAMLAFIIACMVIAFRFALSDLLTAWHTGQDSDWSDFWTIGVSLLSFSPFLIFTREDLWKTLGEAPERVRLARQAARAADNSAAPLAQTQPASLESSNISRGDGRELTLRRPRGTSRDMVGICGWCVIVLGTASLFVSVLMLSVSFYPPSAPVTKPAAVMLALSGSALIVGGWLLVRMGKAMARVIVRADELGIAWRSGTRRARWHRITWDQALAFVTLSCRSMATNQHRSLYTLDTPVGVLCWEERDLPFWETDRDANEAERENASYLRRLIVTRTGLPLRDVSSALDPVKTVQPAKPALKLPLGPPGSLRHVPVDELIVEPVPPAPAQPPRLLRVELFALACLSVLTLQLYGAGWGLQHYQPRYYAGLLAKAHAEQPLYLDALASDDGDWGIQQPTADNKYTSFGYIDGAYHVKGTVRNGFLSAWTLPSYGNVAVEVTASQRSTDDGDGVGLVLRMNDNNTDFLAFYVDSSGWFWLEHHTGSVSDGNWNWIGGDNSSAIHIGVGASNRLQIIVRSTQMICFINGRFVGTYSDGDLWLNGHIGVYVNDSTTEGIFTNFAAYPVPPPPFPFF